MINRMSFLLVPIPGLTAWVKERESEQRSSPNSNHSTGHTRSGLSRFCVLRSEFLIFNQYLTFAFLWAVFLSSDSRKRNAAILSTDEQGDMDDMSNHAKLQAMDVDEDMNKKKYTEAGKYACKDSKINDEDDQPVGEVVDTSEMFSIFSKSFPGVYDEEEGICCLAKMYDFTEGTFRLNDMIEIVGIFTADPILCAVDDRDGDGDGSALADLMDPFRGFEDEEDSLMLPPPR